ncbi:MAG: FtsX-like permease family protein [Eubacteriaceae bacterium]
MNKFFYLKLARTNLRKNKTTYIPFILTCIASCLAFYMMSSIGKNPGIDVMPGSENLKIILNLGTVFIGIFSGIFLFYTHHFLMKQRKKEIALYGILGLEKKHLGKVLLYETLIVLGITLILGLGLGVLLSKLMFLLLLNFIAVPKDLAFGISVIALGQSVLLFTGIFLGMLIKNFIQVKMTSPIKLLQGEKEGEGEPKTPWILTLIGIFALGAGYGIALMVKSPIEALALFFVAVICVVIGTYALFTSGSISILKGLKRNKDFFYKPQNFISVSGMLYRMRQNAVGLANICILCTMVLVTLTTTGALFIGQKDMERARYPYDVEMRGNDTTEVRQAIEEAIAVGLSSQELKLVDTKENKGISIAGFQEEDHFRPVREDDELTPDFYNYYARITFMPLEDYNAMENKNEILGQGEALVFSNLGNYGKGTLTIKDQTYKVSQELKDISLLEKVKETTTREFYIIINDLEEVKEIAKAFESKYLSSEVKYFYRFNLEGAEDSQKEFGKILSQISEEQEEIFLINNIFSYREEIGMIFGGFLFIGIFLGTLFVMATALIIYYKQISEGYDDHKRFEIMQKVGMDKQEIKKTIRKQIVMIFFLPLIMAIIHMMVAFPIMTKLLAIFALTNIGLIIACAIGVTLAFVSLYAGVYMITARAYYRIVE